LYSPFENLGPETILAALESVGFEPNGSLLALNSYENRVYQAQTESLEFYVAKFYRPERWTHEAIKEEHDFSYELLDSDISVVAPIKIEGSTIFDFAGYHFAIFPRQGGHPPNLENKDDLEVLSRSIARIHAIGSKKTFKHREIFSMERLGTRSREFILGSDFLPPELVESYATTSQNLLNAIDPSLIESQQIRIHGDCHMGNVLWRNDISHFVDFDDCLNGPPIQDLWMLLSGERQDQLHQVNTILDAYNEFYEFNPATLTVIEPLRTLRMIHHAAWIGKRWEDPAFPLAFPFFNSAKYWSDHILTLKEQESKLVEEPLYYL
jgi:Ser/Thr protein kinase RdoA (MazF antagonist)